MNRRETGNGAGVFGSSSLGIRYVIPSVKNGGTVEGFDRAFSNKEASLS